MQTLNTHRATHQRVEAAVRDNTHVLAEDTADLSQRENQRPSLIVFSHLRWDFVRQRPQHLLTRTAERRQVFFWEEPRVHHPDEAPGFVRAGGSLELLLADADQNVRVVRPHFFDGENLIEGQRRLLDKFLVEQALTHFDRWYYTPMALSFSNHLFADVTIYDCMDELSAFLNAPAELLEWERELFRVADVVFTGGRSIYRAKRDQHANVHLFPSSIDVNHFAKARKMAITSKVDPDDQASIPHPRAGFFGVLDERFDVTLMREVAALRPDLHLILIGPVVKIDPATLPQAPNLHYLGMKSYQQLPAYLAGWDAAMLPFAINQSTRFISPTKTPEYLAAGKRVVSTPIRDVVDDFGDPGLVEIASSPEEFAAALDRALTSHRHSEWLSKVEQKLSASSWDQTWDSMDQKIEAERHRKSATRRPALSLLSNASRVEFKLEDDSFDYLVAGAGFAGAVLAEQLASQLGKRVLVVDRRPHVGGNAYDFHNDHGILVHQYGPHIFHTSSQKVVDYLSQFTLWRPYEHRVLAHVDGKNLPIPINLDTVNALYDLTLDSEGMEKYLAERVEVRSELRTSEDIVLSRVGRDLYEKFFRNYTRKQWGLDPSQLDACVAGRIPVRFDRDDRYFTDTFQAMPLEGYTRMFERILSHPKITTMLSSDYREVVGRFPNAKIVYTGPIDEFFDYRFGRLPYRSLRFEHKTFEQSQFQTAPVVNYPNDHAFTRVTEFKYLTGQHHKSTSVVYEYPTTEGEPYYPIPRPENTELYERYRKLADTTAGVYFCGRLANYRYFNMDQVVAQALRLFRTIAEDEFQAEDQLATRHARPIARQEVSAVMAAS